MKKILGFLTALVLFCQTQAQKTELDAMTNKCPGGRCQSDCWFTDCSLCCPEGTRADCSCLLEFSRCQCKVNMSAYDAVIVLHAARLAEFVDWLKITGSKLYEPFLLLQKNLLAAQTIRIDEDNFQVSAAKYHAAIGSFEKSVSGLFSLEDYRKAVLHINEQKQIR